MNNNFLISQILDANLDRAREGIRVIEEWCRFGIKKGHLAKTCKDIRQELALWHTYELRLSRNTENDPGIDLSHPKEEVKNNVEELLQANLCRVQEALRVLEEYGKLYDSKMGKSFKKIRYEVYILESSLIRYSNHEQLCKASIYLITSPIKNLFSVVESSLKGGLQILQYREKNISDSSYIKVARKLCELCHQYDALFIMNDRVDIALAINADGVHIGQEDISIKIAREIIGPQKIIGCSTTNPLEMEKAIEEGADYIGVGPIYPTPNKPEKETIQSDYLDYVINKCTIPWFAIGGINIDNIKNITDLGVKQVAVIRLIMEADNPEEMTKFLLKNYLS